MSHYLREEWGRDRGFTEGPINVISQTPNGYLWIGTQRGLVRFDGREFHLFSQSDSNGSPIGPVLGLVPDNEGSLWVRLQGPGLLRYRDGKFEDFTNSYEVPEVAITQMFRGVDGKPVFATILNGTLVFDQGKFHTIAPAPHLPNFLVTSIAIDPYGQFFLGSRDRGLFRIREHQVIAAQDISRDKQINALLTDKTGRLWIGTDRGLYSWVNQNLTHVGIGSSLSERQILSLLSDETGSVWVGTDLGMYRLDSADCFLPKEENFVDGGPVSAIYEDREGNIWVSSTQGLERFRNSIFTTYSASDGAFGESSGPVYVASDGRTWFAPIKGGLYWFKDDKIGHVSAGGLDKDVVYSLAGGNGDLWVARQLGGLTHLHNKDGDWDAVTYTTKNGLAQDSVFTVRVTRNGTVWAGTLNAGLTRIKGGQFTTFTTANGLASNTIAGILEAADGTMWFATPRGLSGLSNDRWFSFSSKDGLPSDDFNCLFEDSAGVLWLGTAKGLAALRLGKIVVPANTPEQLREPILGIGEDHQGFLWISTSNHVLRVNRAGLLVREFNENDLREFDLADGLLDADGVKRDETVAVDAAGQVWFSLSPGLASVDANRLRIGSPPTILLLEGLSADGKFLPLQNPIHAPHPQKITIDFAGLTLSIPDRVRFKYRLDGLDNNWSAPLSARQAIYTNLNPGSYLFRVIASNSDGIWNSRELTVSFKVEPVFWRTWWFDTIAVLTFFLMVLVLVRLRELSLTRQFHVRFEERLSERTRIARELHDTLLQSLQGLLLRFQTASNLLPERPQEAKQKLDSAIDLASQAVAEGRDAVQGLRSSVVVTNDLALAVKTLGDHLGEANQKSPLLDVSVVGTPRDLRPIVRDEAYRIAAEALRNAFRHAKANTIEVEIHYDARHLQLRICDDGKGIDPRVLGDQGRAGHWGLHGMRERAKLLGGDMELWSSAQSGTGVQLTIPASTAYKTRTSLRSWFSRKETATIEE